jgi:uncharacterized protein (TIGR03083 family)
MLPAGLRARVLEASLQARSAGRPAPEMAAISPVEAFGRAADAFHSLLVALAEDDWHVPVLRHLDVQGLVGHLVGVEEAVQRSLSNDPEIAEADHVRSTEPMASRQRGRSARDTRMEWREVTDRTLRLIAAEADLARPVAVHGIRLPLTALLVVRAFELWTHENDIRRALGLPPSVPDTQTLRLMTELAVQLLPAAAGRTGQPSHPVELHLVLTGAGGGTWDLVVGQGAATPTPADVVLDAVDFCRLVAHRVHPSELDVYLAGDRAGADELLTAAASLALD